jgi:hypothetical protein
MMGICLVIFVAVFGVMFYSIFKHRKSLGHKPATFHESTVEIAWTIVPFLIVIGMALPATRTVVGMKDTSNADITIKVTGMQWKWGYDYLKGEGEGISFLSNLSTPRASRRTGEPTEKRGDNYLMEVDNEVVVPVNEDPHGHHRQRRDPLVVDSGLRREAGCDSRLRARHLVQGRTHGHLPRLLLGAVRQGARLHADRGARGHDAEYKTWVDGKKKKWPRWPMIPTRPGRSTS